MMDKNIKNSKTNSEHTNIRNVKILLPTTEEIREACKEYDERAYFGHFAGDEPGKHFQAGVEWLLVRIKNNIV